VSRQDPIYGKLDALLGVWQERAAERRERGELGGAVLYQTVVNELRNALDPVPLRLEERDK